MNRKKIGLVYILLCILCIPLTKVSAADASFSFYPQGGIVENLEEGFTVDILLDSGSNEVSEARMTISFDSEIVQLTKAMKNETLFEQWPEDESSTNNGEGIVMLTGYTPSGSTDGYYSSSTGPDVFARLEFAVIDKEAEGVTFEFEYNGRDELFQTVILDGEIEQNNVLLSKPDSVTFSLKEESIPKTAINTNILGVTMGIVLILAGAFVRSSKASPYSGKRGTIVLNE